jgi:hypothetical protein
MYNNKEDNCWLCKKCNKYISNCVDIDHHNNIVHPNFEDKYIKDWYVNGKKWFSPYD